MSWRNIFKSESIWNVEKNEHLEFMYSLLENILDKIQAKEGKEPINLGEYGNRGGYYYTPNYVLEFFPLIGFNRNERGDNTMYSFEVGNPNVVENNTDWHSHWSAFNEDIEEIASQFGEEYKLKEEDKEHFPIVSYVIGKIDGGKTTLALHCKDSDSWAQSLMEDIYGEIVKKYGPPLQTWKDSLRGNE